MKSNVIVRVELVILKWCFVQLFLRTWVHMHVCACGGQGSASGFILQELLSFGLFGFVFMSWCWKPASAEEWVSNMGCLEGEMNTGF